MLDVSAVNREDLVAFYSETGAPSLFHIWEDGGTRGDSVTPSTYSPKYRTWMANLISTELQENDGALLSLGCGNAAVEAEVMRRGYDVLALDAVADAVDLARAKGVNAVQADICEWLPDQTWSVGYIDGVLGHLWDPIDGLIPILSRIRTWLAPESGSSSGVATLIASNDAPKDGTDVQEAPGVNGFHWLSTRLIAEQALAAGFTDVHRVEYIYSRPLSGKRSRAVVTCRFTTEHVHS